MQWALGDPLPEGLDVGDATEEMVTIDLDEGINLGMGLSMIRLNWIYK